MENLGLSNKHRKPIILIIGATGFVGNEIYKNFKLDLSYETYGTYFKKVKNNFYSLDMNNLEKVKSIFSKIQPDIVVATAAVTNVEYCETNKTEANKVNVIGIQNIVKVCKQYDCKLVYISTEYVFDGIDGPYNEANKVNPINYYGKTKLQGEKIIQNEIDKYLIVRTTVVYGWNLNSKNFIMQLIKNLSENKSMKVPTDQISSPTYCPNLSMIIKECCDKDITGIINVVGSDIVDRYKFALKAAEIFGLSKNLLVPVKTINLGQTASRPLNAGLKVDKVKSLLTTKPLGIDEGLKNIKLNYDKYEAEEVHG